MRLGYHSLGFEKDLLSIVVVVIGGVFFFLRYRASRKFHENFQSLDEKDKKAYIENRGHVSVWEAGSVSILPKPIAFIGKALVILTVAVMVLFIIYIIWSVFGIWRFF